MLEPAADQRRTRGAGQLAALERWRAAQRLDHHGDLAPQFERLQPIVIRPRVERDVAQFRPVSGGGVEQGGGLRKPAVGVVRQARFGEQLGGEHGRRRMSIRDAGGGQPRVGVGDAARPAQGRRTGQKIPGDDDRWAARRGGARIGAQQRVGAHLGRQQASEVDAGRQRTPPASYTGPGPMVGGEAQTRKPVRGDYLRTGLVRAATTRASQVGHRRATNRRRAARPIHWARLADRCTRALSVAMPVFAYICRYSFEISTNATRDRSDLARRASAPRCGPSCRSDPRRPACATRISSAVIVGMRRRRSSAARSSGISQCCVIGTPSIVESGRRLLLRPLLEIERARERRQQDELREREVGAFGQRERRVERALRDRSAARR